MNTVSLLTLELARGYGVVILAIALGALLAPKRFAGVVADFERSPGLAFLSGLFAAALGLGLVAIHAFWTDAPAVLVSALNWAVLIKGLVLLAAPDGMLRRGWALAASPSVVRIWAMVALALGAAMLTIGLVGRAQLGL